MTWLLMIWFINPGQGLHIERFESLEDCKKAKFLLYHVVPKKKIHKARCLRLK